MMRPSLIIFYLLSFFAPYSEALKTDIGPAQISLPYILALAGLVALLIEHVQSGKPRREWDIRMHFPTLVFLLVYFGIGCLGILRIQMSPFTYSHSALYTVVEQLGRLFFSACIMVFVSAVVSGFDVLLRAMKVTVVSAGLVALYGIYQVVGTFHNFYRPLIPHTGSYGLAEGMEGASRAIGTMQEPSYLAGYLCFSIIVTLMLLSGFEIRGRGLRTVMWISLSFQALGMVLTTSTGGYVGLAVGLVIILFVLKGPARRRLALMLAAAAIVVTVVILSLITSMNLQHKLIVATVGKIGHESAFERANFVSAALKMFADYPLFGVGPGLYCEHVWNYTSAFSRYRVLIANNVYAELLAETGLAGFACFAWMLGSMFRRSLKNQRFSPKGSFIAAGIGIALVSLIVQFLAYPTFKMEFIWYMFGLIAAHPAVGGRGRPPSQASAEPAGSGQGAS
jgi:O-antigen ligase